MSKILEIEDELKYTIEAARRLDCWAIKFKHEGIKGAPDRMVLLPNNRKSIFIEFKRRGRKDGVSPHQEDFMKQLEEFGHSCYVCHTWEEALEITRRHL